MILEIIFWLNIVAVIFFNIAEDAFGWRIVLTVCLFLLGMEAQERIDHYLEQQEKVEVIQHV